MSAHRDLDRGRRAQELLDNDLWREAWEAYRARLLEVIEQSKSDEDALSARRMLQAAVQARAHLERIVVDGVVAAADIEASTGKKPRWRVLGN